MNKIYFVLKCVSLSCAMEFLCDVLALINLCHTFAKKNIEKYNIKRKQLNFSAGSLPSTLLTTPLRFGNIFDFCNVF